MRGTLLASSFHFLLASALVIAPAVWGTVLVAQERPTPVSEVVDGDAMALFQSARKLLIDGADSGALQDGLAKLRQAADAGVVPAMLRLGDVLAAGEFGQQADAVLAAQYYQKVADGGEIAGLLRLGNLYRDGAGLSPDGALAAGYYRQAIALDSNAARRYLGAMLLEGALLPQDSEAGIALYRQAIERGDASASLGLAYAYRDGKGVVTNYRQAVDLLTPLVAEQNLSALNALGDLYRAGGPGLPADPSVALGYYRTAADGGNTSAVRRLADMLIRGEGQDADFAGGIALLSAQADSGDASLLLPLGDYHLDAAFGHVDVEAALSYYQRAADAGNVNGLLRIAALYRDGVEEMARDGGVAARYYREAIAADSNAARRALAQMLLAGAGIEVDVAEGLSLYEEAIARGDNASVLQLAEAYRLGSGVVADGQRARAMLEPLADSGNSSALNALGDLYRLGAANLPADAAEARARFGAAMKLGSGGAAFKLADMLIRGEGAAPDFAAGIELLVARGVEGNAAVAVRLGDYFADPAFGHVDAQRAIASYRQAAADGSATGLLRLAELYRKGAEGLAPNGALAVTALQEAITAGNNTARRTLAEMLVTGELGLDDLDRGLALYAEATALGDRAAALQLGAIYSDGRLIEPDYDLASSAFDSAIAAGHPTARVAKALALMSGPLAATHRPEGVKLLVGAVADDVPTARLSLAQAQLAGRVRGQGVAEAIATLAPAIAADDVAAIRFLIGFYRDGQPGVARPDLGGARALLAEKEDVLGAHRVAMERVLLLGKQPVSAARLADLDLYFAQLDPQARSSAVIRLQASNPNAYVYLVQQALGAGGLYDGNANGMLGRSTIAAISSFCADADIGDICARGPLTTRAARALAGALFATQ